MTGMKSAYELAMERSNSPSIKLTDEQKDALAEIDSKMKAKVAETQIMFDQQISAETDPAKAAFAQQTRQQQVLKIRTTAETEKDAIRHAS